MAALCGGWAVTWALAQMMTDPWEMDPGEVCPTSHAYPLSRCVATSVHAYSILQSLRLRALRIVGWHVLDAAPACDTGQVHVQPE